MTNIDKTGTLKKKKNKLMSTSIQRENHRFFFFGWGREAEK